METKSFEFPVVTVSMKVTTDFNNEHNRCEYEGYVISFEEFLATSGVYEIMIPATFSIDFDFIIRCYGNGDIYENEVSSCSGIYADATINNESLSELRDYPKYKIDRIFS